MAVIVTGGTSGIGLSIAEVLAERGHDVVAFGLEEADVSDAAQVARVVQHTLDRYGRIDALVNNAAIGPLGTVLDTSEEVWDRIMAVNLRGTFLCCKAVMPHFIAQGGGRIVNIGSGAGWGKPTMLAYATSKGGIMAFSESLAYDHFHDHVRVNVVIPGGGRIPTGMSLARVGGDPSKLGGPGTAAGRAATGEDIARAVAFLLSPDADVISGTVIDVGCFAHQGGPIPQKTRA